MQFQIIVFLISFLCVQEQKPSVDTKDLIGIWQDSPEVASGWSDTYQFFLNGEFIYRYNQMICDKRTLDYRGVWKMAREVLRISVSEKTVVEGGKLVPAMGSCASENAIEGGEIKIIKDTSTYGITLSNITVDKENRDLKTITLNGKRFWKLKDDPTHY